MKILTTLILGLLITVNLFGQNNKIKELIQQGTKLYDQGKFDDAAEKHKEALVIDKNDIIANYELAKTCFAVGKYDEAIKYGRRVTELNAGCMLEAIIIIGNSFDLKGETREAIKYYEWGLLKFPENNMLLFNQAVCFYNSKDFKMAEITIIKAINSDPFHASSHMLLANIMENQKQRIKSILPLYQFLLLEPNSKRSNDALNRLKEKLMLGVKKESEAKININLSSSSLENDEFKGVEMMLGLLGASRYVEENEKKSDIEYFSKMNQSLFIFLGEIKKDNSGIWWDFYVKIFDDLIRTNNCEAFSYFIQKSLNESEVEKWLNNNREKMNLFAEWMRK
jgi:hypothetical protein